MKPMKNTIASLLTHTLTLLPEHPSYQTKRMGQVLFVASSNRAVPMGYSLHELAVPLQQLSAAGYEVVVATPDGNKPVIEPQSNDRGFSDDSTAVQQAIAFVDSYSGLQTPQPLATVLSAGLDHYRGIYVSGGYAPMTDLMQGPDFEQVLHYFHRASKPIALLGCGLVTTLATLPNAAAYWKTLVDTNQELATAAVASWQDSDSRRSVGSEAGSNQQDLFTRQLPLYVADTLRHAGEQTEHAPNYQRVIVQDRDLIPSQNSTSVEAIAEEFIEALDEARVIPTWVRKYWLGHA